MNKVKPIRVVTVDDHPVFREGIPSMLLAQKDMELVAEAATGLEVIQLYAVHRLNITSTNL